MVCSLKNVMIVFRRATNHVQQSNRTQFACYHSNAQQKDKEHIAKWIESLNEADKKKIRYIQNEMTIYALECARPFDVDRLKLSDFQRIASLSVNQRKKYYGYLSSCIGRKDQVEHRSGIKSAMRAEYQGNSRENKLSQGHIQYGLGANTLFRRIVPANTIDICKNRKVYRETMLDQPQLIFDCSFGDIMTERETIETAKQLTDCIAVNRDHRRPFSLQFSNIDQQGQLWNSFLKSSLNIEAMKWYFRTHDYYNQIPKDKLIIITPDSPNMLKEFELGKHYVLEATVNRSKRGPVMMAKAKELGLQTAALPVNLYRRMHRPRPFPLQHVTSVLLDVREHGNWDMAFNHFAKRLFK